MFSGKAREIALQIQVETLDADDRVTVLLDKLDKSYQREQVD